ncbi:MAG: hypothetical protein ABI132_01075 [Rhodanobacteraceae bacterium]
MQTALALPDAEAANAGGALINNPAHAIAKNPIMVFIMTSLDSVESETTSFDDANVANHTPRDAQR